MKRREFIAGVAVTAALTSATRAQRTEPTRRVEVLVTETIEGDPYYEDRLTALKEGLKELGWIEGSNLKLTISRVAPKAADIRKRIDEILSVKPDLIVASGGTITNLLRQATKTVPVVFLAAVDPVGAGFVESLAHPGGNVTGFMQFDYSLSAKWPEILKQVAPAVRHVGVIRDASTTAGIGQFAVIQSVAGSLGIDVFPIGTTDSAEVESGMARIARSSDGGLIATTSSAAAGHRPTVLKLAAQLRLPAVYVQRIWVDNGGLVSYGPELLTTARLAAGYVDRILKGEKPADLPVQAPNKYELVINLKTAKALGLTISPSLLARADEVIE
jgi:putative tryptophan/tyrosine transport system substrate-binding protein